MPPSTVDSSGDFSIDGPMVDTGSPLHVVFMGVGGCGKSTIANAFVVTLLKGGRVPPVTPFKSGHDNPSQAVKTYQVGNICVVDTPGLPDGAPAINKFFKHTHIHRLKLVYVMKPEGTRVRPADHDQLKNVLRGMPQLKDNQFSLILNRLSRREKIKTEEKIDEVIRHIFNTEQIGAANPEAVKPRVSTNFICIVRRVEDWVDEDESVLRDSALDEETFEFLLDNDPVVDWGRQNTEIAQTEWGVSTFKFSSPVQ